MDKALIREAAEVLWDTIGLVPPELEARVRVTHDRLLAEIGTWWDPRVDQKAKCRRDGCNHRYDYHFDSYEDMEPVGCKHCECRQFRFA